MLSEAVSHVASGLNGLNGLRELGVSRPLLLPTSGSGRSDVHGGTVLRHQHLQATPSGEGPHRAMYRASGRQWPQEQPDSMACGRANPTSMAMSPHGTVSWNNAAVLGFPPTLHLCGAGSLGDGSDPRCRTQAGPLRPPTFTLLRPITADHQEVCSPRVA